jgi:hypothetical protein
VKRADPRKLKRYAFRTLGLASFFRKPGDGRPQPQIPAVTVSWGFVGCRILRATSFRAIEAMVRSPAKRALTIGQGFGDDTLSYFTERLDPSRSRKALYAVAHRAKRNKVFEDARFIGLALDGTGACHTEKEPCTLCHPITNDKDEVVGHLHHFSMASLVGVGLTLPVDVEPYGPRDSEYAASGRMLQRCVEGLGRRFLDYVVADGLYAGAPFLHLVGDLGLHPVVRLKDNLPELSQAVEARFRGTPPTKSFRVDGDLIEAWDADDFDPWETLRWETVRVLRYRQHKRDGSVVEADWLTDWPTRQAGTRALYGMSKSRWETENGGFNDGKNRYGMEHLHHHEENSMLVCWLLAALAMAVERLFRIRYLHRGQHPVLSPIELLRHLLLRLGSPAGAYDTS